MAAREEDDERTGTATEPRQYGGRCGRKSEFVPASLAQSPNPIDQYIYIYISRCRYDHSFKFLLLFLAPLPSNDDTRANDKRGGREPSERVNHMRHYVDPNSIDQRWASCTFTSAVDEHAVFYCSSRTKAD